MSSNRKLYKQLERDLISKHKDFVDTQVELFVEDFIDGQLSYDGFEKLKQRAQYINVDELELIVPQGHEGGIKKSLDFFSARELASIRKDKIHAVRFSTLSLILGLVVLAVGLVFSEISIDIISELFIIISWVFIWAAVEKSFFDMRQLKRQRNNLLQILTAKVISVDNSKIATTEW